MLYGALDYWTLFHIAFGVFMAQAHMRAWPTFGVAMVWEWLEYSFMMSGWQPLPGSAFDNLGNPSVLNSAADVIVAMAGWWWVTSGRKRVPAAP